MSVLFAFESALVLLFRHFCHKRCGTVLRGLWVLVFIISLVPVTFSFGFSPKSNETLINVWNVDTWAQSIAKDLAMDSTRTDVVPSDGDEIVSPPDLNIKPAEPTVTDMTAEQFKRAINWGLTAIVTLWAGMALFLFFRKMYIYVRLCRALKQLSHEDERWTTLFTSCQDLVGGLARRARLRIVNEENVSFVPCVCGFFCPVVYVTEGQMQIV